MARTRSGTLQLPLQQQQQSEFQATHGRVQLRESLAPSPHRHRFLLCALKHPHRRRRCPRRECRPRTCARRSASKPSHDPLAAAVEVPLRNWAPQVLETRRNPRVLLSPIPILPRVHDHRCRHYNLLPDCADPSPSHPCATYAPKHLLPRSVRPQLALSEPQRARACSAYPLHLEVARRPRPFLLPRHSPPLPMRPC